MGNEFKYCLVQYFSWQVDKRKQKQFLKCEECPFREKCKKDESGNGGDGMILENIILDEDIVPHEKMKQEAILRLQRLELDESVIENFKNGKLSLSDHNRITDVPEDILKQIKEWENKFHNLVYHVVHGDFRHETYECLSVSCYEEDWDFDGGQ